MGRQNRNQSARDHRVCPLTNKLRNGGGKIQADLRNLDQSDPIGNEGRIPDILAIRGNRLKIIEVETPSTVDAHQEHHSTFRCSAAQRENGELELVVTKPRHSSHRQWRDQNGIFNRFLTSKDSVSNQQDHSKLSKNEGGFSHV